MKDCAQIWCGGGGWRVAGIRRCRGPECTLSWKGRGGQPRGPAVLSAASVHSCRRQGAPQHPGTSWEECASLSCARLRAAVGFPLEPRPPARPPPSACLPAASCEPPREEARAAPGSALQGSGCPSAVVDGGWRRRVSLGHWLGPRLCSGLLTSHLLPCLHFCPEWEQLGGTPQPPQKTCLQAEG